jgi:copper oxidase (laccase) domain-containing protein
MAKALGFMNENVIIKVSTQADGSMSKAVSREKRDANRRNFLAKNDMTPESTALVQLDYDSEDFCRYEVAGADAAGEGMVHEGRVADGLATKAKGLALFLPLADCVGVVLYDPEHEALMLTHLGRHNLEQHGGQKSVEFMTEQFATDPAKLDVWLSPSAGQENYPLYTFDNKSIQAVTIEQLEAAGVRIEQIESSSIDTTRDDSYFSHSEFLKGKRETDGRFTVVAMLAK